MSNKCKQSAKRMPSRTGALSSFTLLFRYELAIAIAVAVYPTVLWPFLVHCPASQLWKNGIGLEFSSFTLLYRAYSSGMRPWMKKEP